MRSLLPALAVLACICLDPSAATHSQDGASFADEQAIEFNADVVYGRAGERELRMNIARPKSSQKVRPAVLIFHGGAWMSGKKEVHDPLARWLAHQGYVAATVGYRLAPLAPWPAQIEDAKCAVRYLRASSERLGIDPTRMAAMGFSAGGHLAMLLGTLDPKDGLAGTGGHGDQSSKVQAAVSFYGPADLDPEDPSRLGQLGKFALAKILGPVFAKAPKAASPITYVDEGDAAMLLFQGTSDRLVPYSQTKDMLDRLASCGVEAEVVFLVGQRHAWLKDPYVTDTLDTTLRFLDRRLRPGHRASLRDHFIPSWFRRKRR